MFYNIHNNSDDRYLLCHSLWAVNSAKRKQKSTLRLLLDFPGSLDNKFVHHKYLFTNPEVIQYMTLIEKDYSMNNFQISIAIKSVIAQLINSIFVPVMVNYYVKDDIFGTSGLV